MARVAFTKDLFLWCMSIIYLFAFSSLYVQIPGLYGDNGLMPARLVMDKEAESLKDLLDEPSLLKLTPKLGLDTSTAMDLLCLAGMLISFLCMVSYRARDFLSFTILWVLYLSLYQVGQTFLWFQWDILLLEAGFLTLLVAPLSIPFFGVRSSAPHDYVTLWLVRWLLFRLMFASGVVKLTSQCPTWWGLSALSVHFESQCIPTPLAWYWHHFPEWFLRLGVVGTYVIEIGFPFLFFSPLRSLRVISFYAQVVLQILIILTGNYNFFNLLTITLCVPLLDDEVFFGAAKRSGRRQGLGWKLLSFFSSVLVPGLVLGWVAYYTQKLFNLQLKSDFTISAKIAFSEKQYLEWLEHVMPWTIRLGAASLALEVLLALVRSFTESRGIIKKNIAVIQSLFFGALAVAMFGISLVDHSVVERKTFFSLPPQLHELHKRTEPYSLTSSYGLFRMMTGVGGRPEVVVEGSYEKDKGWKEYSFLYKPGNLATRPPVVAPHQPRLDWQMWFAALSNYQNNPWFVTLIYRLLNNQPEVLELMADNPFPDKAPNYVRATLYHYHYTANDPKKKGYSAVDWWTRKKQAEYVPPMSKDQTTLKDFLKHYRILEDAVKQKTESTLAWGIKQIREQIGQPEGFTFVMSLFGSGLLINLFNVIFF
ncbi:lipase maturation factor 2-like isoform X2 [Littorina saxatilis]|uniref:lipase maturation factor 2-like isoform X2 n=1 Tax=Littorina saxatilis TaxID=31220 RepID=UPI0038B673F1